MSGDECNPAGYDFEEGKRIAMALDGHVDLIHVSTGHHEVRDAFTRTHPSMFDPDGVNAHYAADIKKLVKTPVATVGAFTDPAQMEELIASGQVDVVEVARGLIADPDLPRKARAGKDEDIRQCLRCFTCFSNELTNRHIICSVNPEIGNESECMEIRPAKVKKTILVAGGGIGGMQAALEAAKAGHQVILCEKTGRLGGALRCEDQVPFKQKLRRYLDQQARLVAQAGVDIQLNTTVTPQQAQTIAPDVIIAALGARPAIPPVPGIQDSPIVRGAEEVYYHPELAGKRVVTLGGGLVGIELSLYLAGMGHEVTIVEMMPELNNGGNILHQIALDQQLRDRKVTVHLSTKALEITDQGLSVELPDGTNRFLAADTVIYATGQRPLWDEAKALSGCAPEFYQLGDCVTPKNIYAATQAAANIVRNLGRF
jgi:NADPH-dependent 2,4-dienoyl-CoA reductase/sulfur reductase-like enzyme